jgi:hypothetical protein
MRGYVPVTMWHLHSSIADRSLHPISMVVSYEHAPLKLGVKRLNASAEISQISTRTEDKAWGAGIHLYPSNLMRTG